MISRSERDDLVRLARMRARVAKDSIAAREAELLADVEEQLAAVYRFDEDVWEEITRQADTAVKRADAKIAVICRELGVPERFRPRLSLGWYHRGENAVGERRTELRRLAQTRLAAAGQAAKLEIQRHEVDVVGELLTARIETAEGKAFLERLPSVEQLMPAFSIAELGADAKPAGSGGALTRSALLRAEVAAKLMEGPNLSDRAIARELGASPTTVGTIRAELSNVVSEEPSNLGGEPSSLDTPDGQSEREP